MNTKTIYITIDGGAHRIKTFKSLESFKKSIIDRVKPEYKQNFINDIKELKKEQKETFDRYIKVYFKNGYTPDVRIQKHILQ